MSTARRYCPAPWNDINLRPPPPPGVAGWLSSPSPPRRAPAQWVRRSGGECECGIVAPMPPPRPNPTPAHPSAHPPLFDDPEDIVPIDVVAIARVVERRRSAARRAIDRDGPMDGGGGGDGRAVSVIRPSPRTIPTAGEEARGDEVRAREEGSTTRGATEPLAAAHHRGDRADPISVCPRTLGSCLPDRALGRIPRRRPRRGCGANDGDDHGGDECDASFGRKGPPPSPNEVVFSELGGWNAERTHRRRRRSFCPRDGAPRPTTSTEENAMPVR